MHKLKCVAQNYEWGLQGWKSTVGRLYALGSGSVVNEDKQYAELWMGTHPNGPSEIFDGHDCINLQKWIQSHPISLGVKVNEIWGNELPFLFKVLSVAKALSIQAHPDKQLAGILHATQPKNYKDSNHKPEMALAVTRFEALCGFVSLKELADCIEHVPELRTVIGDEPSDGVSKCCANDFDEMKQKDALKSAFSALMTRDSSTVMANLEKLVNRLQSSKVTGGLSPKEELVLRLYGQYPGDVGVFSTYFFNYLKLNPGEAIALPANEPHAYLSGECIECMATSDNVVRAGLTPKYRDTETLCSMLTYKQGPPEILKGSMIDSFSRVYSPPFDEFEIEKIKIPLGGTYTLKVLQAASIMIVLKGSGSATWEHSTCPKVIGVSTGEVYFFEANSKVTLNSVYELELEPSSQKETLEVYRATVNSRVFS